MRTAITLIAFAINLFVDEFMRHMLDKPTLMYHTGGGDYDGQLFIVIVFWTLIVMGMLALDIYTAVKKY